MKFKVLGKTGRRTGEFNGRPYANYKLYVIDLEKRPDVTGDSCSVLTVPEKCDLSSLKPGDTVDVFFNRFGRVDDVCKV